MKGIITSAAALTVALACAQPASADPVRIASGSLQYTRGVGFSPVTLAGARDFTFAGRPGLGVFDAFDCVLMPCTAGDTLSLRAHWSGADLGGTASIDGATYRAVGALSSNASMSADFFGSLTLPSTGVAAVRVVPFRFAGQFSVFDLDATRTYDLTGLGLATASFARTHPGATWSLDSLRYDLGDVSAAETLSHMPEPSTLALVVVGVGILVRKRSR